MYTSSLFNLQLCISSALLKTFLLNLKVSVCTYKPHNNNYNVLREMFFHHDLKLNH